MKLNDTEWVRNFNTIQGEELRRKENIALNDNFNSNITNLFTLLSCYSINFCITSKNSNEIYQKMIVRSISQLLIISTSFSAHLYDPCM